jgi:hypothetical protein
MHKVASWVSCSIVIAGTAFLAACTEPVEEVATGESSLIPAEEGGSIPCGNGRAACPGSMYCAPTNPYAYGPDPGGWCRSKVGAHGTCLAGRRPRADVCAAGLTCVAVSATAYCLPPRNAGAGSYCESDDSYFTCAAGLSCAGYTCTAPPPPPAPPPSTPPPSSGPSRGDYAGSCAGFNDATYCGLNYIRAGDPSILYDCRGGNLYVNTVCANGCNAIRGPENDHCL